MILNFDGHLTTMYEPFYSTLFAKTHQNQEKNITIGR